MATAKTHMKELEQVLQRVVIRDLTGELRPLREGVYAVLRVLADAIDKNKPDQGCQMSIAEIRHRSKKQSSAIYVAFNEATSLGLLKRSKPESGARYATHINFLHQRLIEASQKSRPFKGPQIIFDQPIKTTKKVSKNANLKEKKMAKSEQNQASQTTLDVRKLDVQNVEEEHVVNTPRPRPECIGLDHSDAADALNPLLPAPPGGRGVGIPGPVLDSARAVSNDFLEGLIKFSDFLINHNITSVRTEVQRRRKSDGQRGGLIKNFQTWPQNYDDLKDAVLRAALNNHEISLQAEKLLLIDDFNHDAVNDFLELGLACAVIETSPDNFQVLIPTHDVWQKEQVVGTQKALCSIYGGDANSTQFGKIHRLPGSMNKKNGGCFVTKLHLIQDGELIQPMFPIQKIESNSMAIDTRPPQRHRSLEGVDTSESGRDFGRACELLTTGNSVREVEQDISTRARDRQRHGDHDDYAKRTVASAVAHLSTKSNKS